MFFLSELKYIKWFSDYSPLLQIMMLGVHEESIRYSITPAVHCRFGESRMHYAE